MDTCFMHIPKAAGVSVRAMLQTALPAGSLAPHNMDRHAFSSFTDFARLPADLRASIVLDDADLETLGRYPSACGHFTLHTLDRIIARSRIATILREPRARVLSQYLFLRLEPRLRTVWQPYDSYTAAEGSFADFLGDARVATATDNRVCRMLLHGDARIADGRFIADGDVPELTEAAWERLDQLGFVGLLELPDAAWRGVGELFGVPLEPVHRHVTGAGGAVPGMLPVPAFGGTSTLDLLRRRTVCDAQLYERIAARHAGPASARRLADGAFADALVRYGSFTTSGGLPAAAHTEPSDAAAALEAMLASRSWRLTRPLRRAGHELRRARRFATPHRDSS